MLQKNDLEEKKDRYPETSDEVFVLPASAVQERLWFIDELAKNPLQNVTYAVRIRGNLEVERLERCVNELVARHEILRTSFQFYNRELRQVILPSLQVKLSAVDISRTDPADLEAQARQTAAEYAYGLFDIAKAPLFRVVIIKLSDLEFIEVLVFHHLIFDGQSLRIFLREMNILYEALSQGKISPLPGVSLQFADFALWQKEQMEKGKWQDQVDYWKQKLETLPDGFDLPLDYPRPPVRTFKGKRKEFQLTPGLSRKLNEFCQQKGVTLFMMLEAIFKLLLFRYTGQRDLTVGCPVANRDSEKTMNMLGPLADITVLRSVVPGDFSFSRFLEQEQEVIFAAFSNKEVPLDQVIKIANPGRADSRSPLFQVFFSFEPGNLQDTFEFAGLKADPFTIEFDEVYFDMGFIIYHEKAKGISGSIAYNTDLFHERTIAGMLTTFLGLMERVAVGPDREINDLLAMAPGGRSTAGASPAAGNPPGEISTPLAEVEEIVYYYGYFEDTFTSRWKVHRDSPSALLVGDPVPGKELYILDVHLNPVPHGAFGELYIGGGGDFSEPHYPRDRVVPGPFPGQGPLYRTGEVARWSGARQLQVNAARNRFGEYIVSGQRVSLPQCEQALLDDEQIEDVHVVVRKVRDEFRPVVFYSARNALEPEELTQIIAGKGTSVPGSTLFQRLQHIPLLENGRVDTRALERVAILPPEVIPQIEQRVKTAAPVDEAVAIVKETGLEKTLLDLSRLLPVGESDVPEPAAAELPPKEPESLPPALAFGGEMDLQQEPLRVGDYLLRAVKNDPGKKITAIDPDGREATYFYTDLLHTARIVLTGLRRKGLEPRDKVILLLKNDWDFITGFWGCILGGFVPVPLSTPTIFEENEGAVKKVFNILKLLDDAVVLTRQHAKEELSTLSANAGAGINCEVMEEVLAHEPGADLYQPDPDDLALMMFTSGSTGMPKGVTQTHRALISRTLAVPDYFALGPGDVSLNWMPLDHVATLVMTHMRDIFRGLTIVLVAKEIILQDPLKWLDLIHRFRANYTWSANFAFGLVNDSLARMEREPDWDLSCMKYIINAGESVVPKTTRQFLLNLKPYGLPANAMNPSWGMSETCSTTIYENFSLETTSDRDSFTVCGKVVPGLWMRIVDNDNRVVPEKTEGSLQVKGICVTKGYYKNEAVNKESYTDDGWFVTGDLGYISDGKLTLTGRGKDVIIINGINYYSHEIEAVVETVEGVDVSFTAACAVRKPEDETDQLTVFFSTSWTESEIPALFQAIRGAVRQGVGVTPVYLIPVAREVIPKTEIGKIQRSKLGKMFDEGQFDAILKTYSTKTQDLVDRLPFQLYRPYWRKKPAHPTRQLAGEGGFLFFNDGHQLNQRLIHRLQKETICCISVSAAETFKQISAADYTMKVSDPAHYRRLLEDLEKQGLHFSTIVHSFNYSGPSPLPGDADSNRTALERGVYSLLYLVQALLANPLMEERNLRLVVITSNLYPVENGDFADPAKAVLTGLLKTIPLEAPQLSCRHIDLSMTDVETDARHVLNELTLQKSEDQVAYRGGDRYVFRLEPIDFSPLVSGEARVKEGGFYLVTGGLGGIGKELSLHLLEKYRAKLLILGRTALPDRHLWAKELAENSTAAMKIKSLQELEQAGGQVVYESVNAADGPALEAAVNRWKNQWQTRLSGIFHLAGTYKETFISGETRENFEAGFEAKVFGTQALYRLLKKENQKTLFVAFSSLYGVTGGTLVGSYAAANSFLDSMVDHMHHDGSSNIDAFCFNWSMWKEIGMSRQSKIIAEFPDLIAGSEFITPGQGIKILEVALRYGLNRLLIGLNHDNPFLWKYLEYARENPNKLILFFTSAELAHLDNELKNALITDFDLYKIPLEVYHLEEIPRVTGGEIDRKRLKMLESPGGVRSQYIPPETRAQKEVATIWSQLLDLPQVGIDDKFFEIGGDSVRIVRMTGILKKNFSIDINVVDLFKHKTVRLMAAFLEKSRPELREEPGMMGIEL